MSNTGEVTACDERRVLLGAENQFPSDTLSLDYAKSGKRQHRGVYLPTVCRTEFDISILSTITPLGTPYKHIVTFGHVR